MSKEDKNAKKGGNFSKRFGDKHRPLIRDESRLGSMTTKKQPEKNNKAIIRLSSIAKGRGNKQLKNQTKEAKTNIYVNHHNAPGADSSVFQMTSMYHHFLAFHLHDDESTFWTFKINEETTAWDICQKIEEKLHLKDNFDCFVQLYERHRELYAVDRLVEDVEEINTIREGWEAQKKTDKAMFVVRVIRVSKHPTRIQLEGYDSGPKIISFLPDKVISRYLFSAGEPPTKPVRDGFPAVVMFVDIAGFTSFTENLLKEGGDQGIEGLTIHLNQFFQKLIGVIKSHHGDVIQFGGDAILVIWHSPLHKLSVLATAACFCGVDIQSTLADYRTSSGKKLSLYVAIAAGTMENIHVGSPGNWIIVFGGEPVSQLSKIMDFCAPGEIVLSVECYGALREAQNDLKLTRKHSAAHDSKRQRRGFLGVFSGARSGLEEDVPYQLHSILPNLKKPTGLGISGSGKKLPQAVWGFLRGYLSTNILDNIDSATLGWMDGLRRLAIMFVNLPGLDNFASPSFLQDMQAATEVLQETTKKWDGSINKYIMDDKGTLLLCAFGMPQSSSVGTSYRAIRAAMTITESLSKRGIACTIGVTTDRTFIGLVGSEQRQEFTIMGDAVNMAARLMKTAKDVLVDGATYNQTSGAFEFEELKDVKVKGKAKTFSAYRPLRVLPFASEPEGLPDKIKLTKSNSLSPKSSQRMGSDLQKRRRRGSKSKRAVGKRQSAGPELVDAINSSRGQSRKDSSDSSSKLVVSSTGSERNRDRPVSCIGLPSSLSTSFPARSDSSSCLLPPSSFSISPTSTSPPSSSASTNTATPPPLAPLPSLSPPPSNVSPPCSPSQASPTSPYSGKSFGSSHSPPFAVLSRSPTHSHDQPSSGRSVSYRALPAEGQASNYSVKLELSYNDLYEDDRIISSMMELLEGMGAIGAVVHATSPLGCGKTLFLRHFQDLVQKVHGTPTFFIDGAARNDLKGIPDSGSLSKTFGTILNFAYGLKGEGGSVVESLVKEHGGGLACLFCSVFGIEVPVDVSDSGFADGFDEEENINHVHSALASKFNSTCDGTKVLFVDNAHLLLEEDWKMLAALKVGCSDFMLVMTSLPCSFAPEVMGLMGDVFDSPHFHTFSLPPLSDSVLMKMMALRLGAKTIDEMVATPLMKNSRENTKELMHLVDVVKDLRMVLDEGEGRAVPNEKAKGTLDSVVQQFNNSLYIDCMDELSPVLQVTLKAAAVAGDEVSISALQYAHPFALSSRQIQLFLYRLHYAGFVEVKEDEEGSIGNTKCCFVSNRIRKWIYNSVLYAHRQKVHQAFAMYYERMINEMDDSRKGLDIVAGHWSKTKTPRRAITFLLEYGNICLHSFDCNSATEVFDRIIQVSEKKGGQATSGSPDTVFFRTLCKEKMAIALGLGGHLTRCLAIIKACGPEYDSCSSEKKFELPWLILRTFVTSLLSLCSDSRRLLFTGLEEEEEGLGGGEEEEQQEEAPEAKNEGEERKEEGEGNQNEEEKEGTEKEGEPEKDAAVKEEEKKELDVKRMAVKVFFSSPFRFQSGGAVNEIPAEWEPIIEALHEMQISKTEALLVGVEEMMEKLMQISKSRSSDGKSQKGKESKSPQSVTPLLMATNAHGVSAAQEFGVVEPHQQVEMYADACLAATVMGYTEVAEHFMSLSHRQGNSVYDIYSYGYALVQSAFLTIPRGLWGISLNNLKLGVTLLQQCKRRVDRVVALAQTNMISMAILQGTLKKALDCITVTLKAVKDEESRLLLYWCRGHILLMNEKGGVHGEELLAPFLEKSNTHFGYQTQLMWVSLVCKRSWGMNQFGRMLASLLDAFHLATKHGALSSCTYLMCFAILNILEVLFNVIENPESLAGIRSRMGKGDPDLRRITETFLGALWRLSSIYIAFEPRFLYFKGRLSWGMGKDKKALKRFATGLEIAGKHQLLLDSALINLAIGERLAVKKERDAALESAKNMLWICDAMAYWESPGEVVEGGEGGEIEGDRGEALKKHSGSDKKLQVKKDTSKRKEKGGKEESSLQQVFASLENDEEDNTEMIQHSQKRASLVKEDENLVLIRSKAVFTDVFKADEAGGQSYRERLAKDQRRATTGGARTQETSPKVGSEGGKVDTPPPEKKKKKKKGFFSGKSEKKTKKETKTDEKLKPGSTVSPSTTPPSPAPLPSPGPTTLSPHSQMERQATMEAAFQQSEGSPKKLHKNISSPPAGQVQKVKKEEAKEGGPIRRAKSGTGLRDRSSVYGDGEDEEDEEEEREEGSLPLPPPSQTRFSSPTRSPSSTPPSPFSKRSPASPPSFSDQPRFGRTESVNSSSSSTSKKDKKSPPQPDSAPTLSSYSSSTTTSSSSSSFMSSSALSAAASRQQAPPPPVPVEGLPPPILSPPITRNRTKTTSSVGTGVEDGSVSPLFLLKTVEASPPQTTSSRLPLPAPPVKSPSASSSAPKQPPVGTPPLTLIPPPPSSPALPLPSGKSSLGSSSLRDSPSSLPSPSPPLPSSLPPLSAGEGLPSRTASAPFTPPHPEPLPQTAPPPLGKVTSSSHLKMEVEEEGGKKGRGRCLSSTRGGKN